jgi:hypothetical protein
VEKNDGFSSFVSASPAYWQTVNRGIGTIMEIILNPQVQNEVIDISI